MKGAIFDMDGLLLDSERLFQDAWRALAEERGIVLGDTFTAEISGSGQEQQKEILRKYYPGADPDALIAACKSRVYAMEETDLVLKKGAVELLETLRSSGFRCAVASSSPLEMVRKNLARTDILKYFGVTVSGEEVSRGKPFPDVFLLAAEKLGLPAEECYVFEDSMNGIRAAAAARCVPVMVPDLVQPAEEIRAMCWVYPDLAAACRALLSEPQQAQKEPDESAFP